jgi:choline dehydrogenase-like flavoprotein
VTDILTEHQTGVLRALCDTVVPAIERADDPDGFWGRRATDVGADQGVLFVLSTMPPDQRTALGGLLDVLGGQGFVGASQESREQILTTLSLASALAGAGIRSLISLILFVTYGMPDGSGANPNWAHLGYPGPLSPAPAREKAFQPVRPQGGDLDLSADVVVVGSGAGGGLIAGRLAAAGANVVVLEAGRYRTEADFSQLEVMAYLNSYWRGGPTPTGDLNVMVMAGSGLGGGTVINWTNCLRTKEWVRRQWADHGLSDVATDAFDRHLDAVWHELSVTGKCSELNGPQEAMRRGAEALGWSFTAVQRNWDESRHDPAMAGYLGFGDQSGAKRSTLKVYLEPAVAHHGTRIVDGCFVEKILTEGGRATGVTGRWTAEDGSAQATVTVRAPVVVLAAGALESPGVLLRSGIGGQAVGDHLRLHPCTVTMGDYGTDQRAWWGAPHAGLVDEFTNLEDGYGFLVEGVQYTTGLGASSVPFTTGLAHKEAMTDYRNSASFIGLVRDHGHGRVTLDAAGGTVPWYSMTDGQDVRMMRKALAAQIRLHHAAGARGIRVLAQGQPSWRHGDDLDAFIARVRRIPLRAGGATLFSAHQMGTCRMGDDPATSVADPRGELHDTPGVWIGDASAFPTPSGTNPMITIMALASRTAENIAASLGARAEEVARA